MSLHSFATIDLLKANADVICALFTSEGYAIAQEQLSADHVTQVHHKSGCMAFVVCSDEGQALLLDRWRGVAVGVANTYSFEGLAVFGFDYDYWVKEDEYPRLFSDDSQKRIRQFSLKVSRIGAPDKSRYVKSVTDKNYKPQFHFDLSGDTGLTGYDKLRRLFDKADSAAAAHAEQIMQEANLTYQRGEMVCAGVLARCGAKGCPNTSGGYLLPMVAFEKDGGTSVKQLIRYEQAGKHDAADIPARGGEFACGVVFIAQQVHSRRVLIVSDLDHAIAAAQTVEGLNCHVVYAPNTAATTYFKAWFSALYAGNVVFVE